MARQKSMEVKIRDAAETIEPSLGFCIIKFFKKFLKSVSNQEEPESSVKIW